MTDEPGPRTTQERIRRMLSPERLERLDPEAVLSLCEVDRHDTVADIGCGPGYFTLPLAKRLTHGKLYALDVDDDMLAACRQRVAAARWAMWKCSSAASTTFPWPRAPWTGPSWPLFFTRLTWTSPGYFRLWGSFYGPGDGAGSWSGLARARKAGRPRRDWSTPTPWRRWPKRWGFNPAAGGTSTMTNT